jgi:hypothetical protein
MRRWGLVSALALAMLLVGLVSSASAASVTIGQTGTTINCMGSEFLLQTGVSGGASYTVPAGTWTLSQWSTQANANGGSMSALVFRATATPGSYLVVAASAVQALTPSTLNTFTADLKVEGGDILGLWGSANTGCAVFTGNGADTYRGAFAPTPPSVGSVVTPLALSGFQLNIEATLDPFQEPAAQPPPTGKKEEKGNKKKKVVAAPTVVHLPSNPPTCSGPYQSRPYLDLASTRADVFDQTTGDFVKDNVSPVAIPLADLPPELAADPYFQSYVGTPGNPTHMMLCNAASVLARYGYQLTLTGVYVDTSGDVLPATPPWVVNGLPRPNVLQVGHATK